jgi:hypothetical protein
MAAVQEIPQWVESSLKAIDMRVDPSVFRQLASETDPVVGFFPPDGIDYLYTQKYALNILAIVTGKKTRIKPGAGEGMNKELHGSAVIVQRESDGQVFAIPNDMREEAAPLTFTIRVARTLLPEALYPAVLRAISLNIDHRRGKFQSLHGLPPEGQIYPKRV